MDRRSRFASVFTKKSIQGSPLIKKIIDVLLFERLLPQFTQPAETRSHIKVLDLNTAYGLDFVSAFTFGLSRDTNSSRTLGPGMSGLPTIWSVIRNAICFG